MNKKIFYIIATFFALESTGFYQNASAALPTNPEGREVQEDSENEKNSAEQEDLDIHWDPGGF